MIEVVRKRFELLLLKVAVALVRRPPVAVLRHGKRGDSKLDPELGLEVGQDTSSGIFRTDIVFDLLYVDDGIGKWEINVWCTANSFPPIRQPIGHVLRTTSKVFFF